MSPQAKSWEVSGLLAYSFSNFQNGVESELTDVCKGATEGVEEEAVTEPLDAIDVPGIVCI